MSALSISCAARKQRQRLGYLNYGYGATMPEVCVIVLSGRNGIHFTNTNCCCALVMREAIFKFRKKV